ncbi:hypothetical protein PRUPE_6G016400 [Prunus persica]|uniref:Uncharacterized protein n=1 Tax=Prunus persica TaxID=3760 RepID=M5W603_PRUPE|nr:hypothetical protein PRUPE_6G016400 [Prunus persica]
MNPSTSIEVEQNLCVIYLSYVLKSLSSRELLHYELVYNYSGSKHITESLKRCGISESSTYVLAACFNSSSDEPCIASGYQKIRETINGKEIELEELGGRVDQAQVQKHYKITSVELGISSLAEAIT